MRSGTLSLLLAGALLLIAIVAGVALAEEPEQAKQSAESFVPGWTLEEAPPANGSGADLLGVTTDLEAAESMPHNDLDRPEAVELADAVFGDVIESAAGIYDGLEVERFHSDYVAVVPGDTPGATGESQSGLLSSTLPLRTPDSDGVKSLVDLDLQQQGDVLEPDNPLVAVEIPTELGEGFALPELDITIKLDAAPAERTPSTVGEGAAFYPNVAADSDLAIAPTATGVETSTILRTPDAPQIQTYRFAMPAGAHLEPTDNGGAIVMKAGDPLLTILRPTAIDAAGEGVPATLAVAGDALEIEVEPTPDTAYPVLVDPIFESYYWDQYPAAASPEWVLAAGPGPRFEARWYAGPEIYVPGIHLASYTGATTPGTQAMANYYVPRFFTDFNDPLVKERPSSYIKNMTMTHVGFTVWNYAEQPYPAMQLGIWSESKGQWVSHGTMNSLEAKNLYPAYVFNMPNPSEVTDAKNAGISLFTGGSTSYTRTIDVGQATVEISDKDFPGFGLLGSASGWVNAQPGSPINYTVSDPGLGIYALQVQQPSAAGGSTQTTISANCLGSARGPCPRTLKAATHPLTYDPSTMPQGENWLKVTATDPIGQKSSVSEARVKVDHTKPSVTFSGTLTEQGTLGTKLPKYTLNYSAADGDEAPAEALPSFGGSGTAPGKTELPMGTAVEANGNVLVVDRANKRVTRFDKNGVFLNQFGTAGTGDGQINDPVSIAVSASGKIWVAEMANARVQLFNSTGTFVRKITCACFSQPYAVATGPNEAVWISDIGNDKLFKYREKDGVQLVVAHGNQANPAGTATDMTNVTGLATDANGNVWAAEFIMNKLISFDANGNFTSQFGTLGSGDGQVTNPAFVTVAPSGNLMVVDYNNNRLQEFRTDGTYLRKFGSGGAGLGQMSMPQGIDFGPNGVLYAADYANHRINRWAHADLDPQSGAVSAEIKVDNQLVKSESPGCSTKNCPITNEWTINADDYPVGEHSVKVTATDGVGLIGSKTIWIVTQGDRKDPTVALSGSMTEQTSLGTTLPAYTLKVDATDPGAAEERKSGVASVTIKVDGVVKDSTSPGCPAGGCSLSREWTLDASKYSAGPHSALVTATDAAGRSATKTLNFDVAKDTTAPTITAANAFYNAPEGWVEQKSYANNATGFDAGGYGITSIALKIDGQIVKSQTQTCPAGGCSLGLGAGSTIDMSAYDGGAHPAELVATDGAGNTAKKSWTINVVPNGEVENGEAENTLDAFDSTAPMNIVGPPKAELDFEGTADDLEFAIEAESIVAPGAVTPVEVEPEAGGSVAVTIPAQSSLEEPCEAEPASEPDEELSGEEEEDLLAEQPSCSFLPVDTEPVPVEITPLSGDLGADDPELTPTGVVLLTDAYPNVDSVIRPLYDGAMIFSAIRDSSGPEAFSWSVHLEDDQSIVSIDNQHAVVMWSDGIHSAFGIHATPAHDADGTSVSTELIVEDDQVITLKVKHRQGGPGGEPFSYPVTAGVGWEGGFQTVQVAMPPPKADEEIEMAQSESMGKNTFRATTATLGAPVAQASTAGRVTIVRAFNFRECHWTDPNPYFNLSDPPDPPPGCHGPKQTYEGTSYPIWAFSMSGRYYYKYGEEVWVSDPDGRPNCSRPWGKSPDRYPHLVHCFYRKPLRSTIAVEPIAHLRFAPGGGDEAFTPGRATCAHYEGILSTVPPSRMSESDPWVVNFPEHFLWVPVWSDHPCPWGNFQYPNGY